MTSESVEQELARLKAENAQLKADKGKKLGITFKVSQKGALSVYGMGRFPVTLYKEQWEKLLAKKDDILQFMQTHNSELKTKE